PQFETFDYREYLARQGISSTINYPEDITFISAGAGSPPLVWIHRLRDLLAKNLRATLPEPESSLAQGIFLGKRGSIPRSLSEAFAHTGTTHILAISGHNLSILAGLLLSLGVAVFGRRHHLHILLALSIIWFYAVLVGLIPSVTRAAIMASLFLAAEFLGRPGSAATATVLAAGVMAGILQPLIIGDVAFQLSFLSILGLIILAPRFRSAWTALLGEKLEGHRWGGFAGVVLDSFGITLAAVLFTWPVVARSFNIVSITGLPATLLIVPVFPAIILLTAATGFLGLVLPAVAQVVAWAAWLPLFYMVAVVKGFNTLPGSYIVTDGINPGYFFGYYMLLFLALSAAARPTYLMQFIKVLLKVLVGIKRYLAGTLIPGYKKGIAAVLICLSFLAWLGAMSGPDGKLHVSFLDAGSGEAVLIQSPGGRNILIDGGASPGKLNLALGEKLPFWERNIDLAVLTAPDNLHLPGLVEVLRRYRVGSVIEPGSGSAGGPGTVAILAEWRREVENRGIPATEAKTGQWVELDGGFRLGVLQAPPGQPGTTLLLDAGEIQFIFAGAGVRNDLLARQAKQKSTILKLPLRDSKNIQPVVLPGGLQAVVVPGISSEKDKDVGDPQPVSGTEVYYVASRGAVEFITDGKQVWVKTAR
ncbi:MAG: ComEC/Rec2 family competence protein, partial [Dehalococcoidia bacterium]|nr:ComEC/Rec2 family competence protein [Dehalococcoidia bacterium]